MTFFEDGRCIWSMTRKGVGTVRSGQYLLSKETLEFFIDSTRAEVFKWRFEFFERDKMILSKGEQRFLYKRG